MRISDWSSDVCSSDLQEILLDTRPCNANGVALLESIFADGGSGHLATDDHHGNGVHVSCGNTGDGSGQARTAGYQRNTDLVGRARLVVGRMDGSLLVANHHALAIVLLVDGVVQRIGRASCSERECKYVDFWLGAGRV